MSVDYYLKLDGIEGEAVSAGFEKQITLLSFSWGGSQTTSVAGTGGSGAGKVNLSDISFMKNYDKASPQLFKSMTLGTHIKTGVVSATKAGSGGKPFLKISLGELFVTSLQDAASSEIPSESVSFSYNTIKVEYSTQNEQGILTAVGAVSYDVKTNKVS
jgi:type VI secretion system secreted protein Hcp